MKIKIDTDQLAGDISAVNEQIDNLNAAKNRVIQSMMEISSMWEGQAHDAFMVQVLNDSQRLAHLIKTMQNMASCLSNAKNQYDGCAEEVRDKIRSICLSGDC